MTYPRAADGIRSRNSNHHPPSGIADRNRSAGRESHRTGRSPLTRGIRLEHPMSNPDQQQTSPGWYPDPQSGLPRWWDGQQWGAFQTPAPGAVPAAQPAMGEGEARNQAALAHYLGVIGFI